jgi:hypothetical protein
MTKFKDVSGKTMVQDKAPLNKILVEIRRIGWEIQKINDHALTLAGSLAETFGYRGRIYESHPSVGKEWAFTDEKPVLIPGKNTMSCILL